MKNTLLIVALSLGAASCKTKNYSGDLVIISIVPPTATAAGTGAGAGVSCAFDSGATEFTPALPYNPAENTGMIAAVVQNNLVSPVTLNQTLRTDTSTFLPHQAVVDYEFIPSSAGSAPGTQVFPTSGVAVPSGAQGTVGVQLFHGLTITAAGGTYIRVTMHLEGKLLVGSTVHTSEREYLFQVCTTAGCGLTGPWAANGVSCM